MRVLIWKNIAMFLVLKLCVKFNTQTYTVTKSKRVENPESTIISKVPVT